METLTNLTDWFYSHFSINDFVWRFFFQKWEWAEKQQIFHLFFINFNVWNSTTADVQNVDDINQIF